MRVRPRKSVRKPQEQAAELKKEQRREPDMVRREEDLLKGQDDSSNGTTGEGTSSQEGND
jgi:L-lactate dehydrogenase complex protein LldF